jgi:hypothetical protein
VLRRDASFSNQYGGETDWHCAQSSPSPLRTEYCHVLLGIAKYLKASKHNYTAPPFRSHNHTPTQQTFRYSDLKLNNASPIQAAASILIRNQTAMGVQLCQEIRGCENNTFDPAILYVLLLRSDLFQTHTVALHTLDRQQKNGSTQKAYSL